MVTMFFSCDFILFAVFLYFLLLSHCIVNVSFTDDGGKSSENCQSMYQIHTFLAKAPAFHNQLHVGHVKETSSFLHREQNAYYPIKNVIVREKLNFIIAAYLIM